MFDIDVLAAGGLAALITALAAWRRGKADTASVLNGAALELVVPLKEQLRELRGEIKAYRHRVDVLERQERELAARLVEHAAYDMQLVRRLAAHGEHVGPMPPLLLPPRPWGGTRASDADLPSERSE